MEQGGAALKGQDENQTDSFSHAFRVPTPAGFGPGVAPSADPGLGVCAAGNVRAGE